MTKLLIWITVAGSLAWGAGVSTADNIGFDGLQHGEIINTQFKASMGVTVSADNIGGGPDLAIGFDSTRTGTADPDLQDPWRRWSNNQWVQGNIDPFTNLGVLLIIAENSVDSNNDGLIDSPDDEASRPAGSLIFEFDDAIDSFGFDLVDIEHEEVAGGYFAAFYSGVSLIAKVGFGEFEDSFTPSPFYDATVNFAGDRTANRISPLTAANLASFTGTSITEFDKVVIYLNGSGAVDNINYTRGIPPAGLVPLPNAAWMGFAMLGALGTLQFIRRRRNRLAA